eukprot:314803-Pelagomonas_calceolata.AAC.1
MLLLLPAQSCVLELGFLGLQFVHAAAPAAGGGQCCCCTGLGSWLVRFRLVGVTGALGLGNSWRRHSDSIQDKIGYGYIAVPAYKGSLAEAKHAC